MQPSETGVAAGTTSGNQITQDSEEAARDLWERCVPELKARLSDGNFTAWFSQTRAESLDGETFVLAVPSAFVRDWIQGRYVNDMRAALTQVAGRPLSIAIVADEALSTDVEPEAATPPSEHAITS